MNVTKYILPESWASMLVNGDESGLTLKEINEVERFTADLPSGTWSTEGESYFRSRNDANELGGTVCDFEFYSKP